MIGVNNDKELLKIMNDIISDALTEVGEKVFEHLMNNLDKWIYNYNKPNISYAYGKGEPTGDFKRSWTTMQTQNGNEHKALIYNEPEEMRLDEYNHIHGSLSLGDLRNDLAAILNEGYGDKSNWWDSPRPYWDELMELISKGYVDKLFKSACQRRGLILRKTMSFSDWALKYNK